MHCLLLLLLILLSFVAGFQDASLCGDSEELSPSNPFLQIQQKEMPLDTVMQAVQVICTKYRQNNYIEEK